MKRGDVFTGVLPGDYGKPRPVVIVQTDLIATVESVLVCPVTSDDLDAPLVRIPIEPSAGVDHHSFIMCDKVMAVRREKCRQRIGALDAATLVVLNRALTFVLGLAE